MFLEDIDKMMILNKFDEVMNLAHAHVNDYYLGTGGFANINDKICVKIHIFPYPKEIIIDVIEKYESYIMDGKAIKTYKKDNFENANEEVLQWVEDTLKEIKGVANEF